MYVALSSKKDKIFALRSAKNLVADRPIGGQQNTKARALGVPPRPLYMPGCFYHVALSTAINFYMPGKPIRPMLDICSRIMVFAFMIGQMLIMCGKTFLTWRS